MDKRTILFVLSLTLALFFVNIYFQRENNESLKQWTEQQKAKKIQKAKQLEEEISQHTAKAETLPIIEIYSDSDATNLLAIGAESNDTILAISWAEHLPEKVYGRRIGKNTKTEELKLVFDPKSPELPAFYSTSGKGTLLVGNLPEFGKYDLQLIFFDSSKQPSVALGEYIDGHFEILVKKLEELHKEAELKENVSFASPQKDAIALLKTTKGYFPVGIYQSKSNSLLLLEEMPEIAEYLKKPEFKQAVTANQKTEEKFFVLENEYQQLVFSNFGGALIEINLPFKSDQDKASVVKEIEFDREMVQKHPNNAHFPAHAYYTPGSDPSGKFEEHSKGKLGGYYPLLRRDLIESNGKVQHVQPKYYALNIVSEYPEVAELVYEVKHFDKNTIVFEANQSHRRITKTFTVKNELNGAPYCLDMTLKIEGDSRGLWITSGIPEVEWISGGPAPALKYRITRNQKADVEVIELPKDSLTVSTINPDWVCNSNGFLGMILDPLTEIDSGYKAIYVPGATVPSRLVEIDKEYDRFKAQNLPGYQLMLPLKTNGGSMSFRVFAGPFADGILKTVDNVYSDPATGYNPDYIACQSFHGWFSFISEPFAKFLFVLMNFFHQITGSWAFSIILLTIALRIMMYPLNAWSTKSMLRMQQIGPEVTAIQEKYKKDPKKAQLEIMSLYRERGVNPVSGCFPLLIQMPFLIGMFDLLKSTFELRGSSFIPGWIDDLTAPDVLFSWSTPIFFIGNQFHLLPFLLGGVMFLQQRLMSTLPKDPNLLTDQQRQQRAMGNVMTVVFTVMFYNFPSGLNIYWLSSMLLGILQQWWTSKQLAKKTQETQKVVVAKQRAGGRK